MVQMFGLYRAKGAESHADLVCYGDGEVDFMTTRTIYEATGMTPQFHDLPWKHMVDDAYDGLECHITSSTCVETGPLKARPNYTPELHHSKDR